MVKVDEYARIRQAHRWPTRSASHLGKASSVSFAHTISAQSRWHSATRRARSAPSGRSISETFLPQNEALERNCPHDVGRKWCPQPNCGNFSPSEIGARTRHFSWSEFGK
jgi:hypothetical protein